MSDERHGTESPVSARPPFVNDPDFVLHVGDVRDVLATLPDESVDCCVTSPPYLGLRDYGIPPSVWGGDPEHAHEWGDELSVRETTYGGKTRWQHVHNGRGEFQESRSDREGWLRSEVTQGRFCECEAWLGVLGLEPRIDMYVANLVQLFRDVRRVLRPEGTLWLNIGDSYNAYNGNAGPSSSLSQRQSSERPALSTGHGLQQKELKPKDLLGTPWRAAFGLQDDGWWLRSAITWCKPNPMPESVRDRPTKSTEMVFLLAKSERYYFGQDELREPNQHDGRRKTTRVEAGQAHPNHANAYGGERWPNEAGRNVRDWWEIPVEPYPEAHFATFPTELARRCILGGCPEGGTVLDPFMGSGTTALVARKLNRRSIGIELNPAYAELCDRRLAQQSLFAGSAA